MPRGTAARAPAQSITARVRYGSSGELVERVQTRLKENGFLDGPVDGDFGVGTLTAIMDCQRAHELSPDGVGGLNTADILGLESDWPKL